MWHVIKCISAYFKVEFLKVVKENKKKNINNTGFQYCLIKLIPGAVELIGEEKHF